MNLDEMVGKFVLVVKNDGYKKYGILVEYSAAFITLKFDSGELVVIPMLAVSEVKLSERGTNGN